MLESIHAELKLLIAGNHDLELDREYWEAQHDGHGVPEDPEDPEDHNLAIKTLTGPIADEAGVIFLNEGTHSLTLKSGARFSIYVSPYTPAFGDWAFAYKHHEDRSNKPYQVATGATSIATNPMPDIVMTHGPPKGILDWCPEGNVGCDNLLQAIRRVKPKMHCFGHIHEGNDVEIIDWETFPLGRSQVRKNAAVHALSEDTVENPYPRQF